MIFYQAWTEPWRNKGKAEQEYLFIHLEFCQSTLKHALLYENRHWFTQKWLLFEEIVRIVHKLHKACVVHRDLKPDNIFFNSELSVRIGDFGDACVGRDEFGLYGGGTPKLGTQYYFAEELNSGGKVTEKVDVYSLGVILFEIFAMFQTGLERNSVFHNLREQGPPDNWDGDRELYDMMTALKPSDRPSTSQILDYIRIHHLE
uniref:Uncharacterized protein n=1 Tax=Avena sativa TaxID=4498 RepID=A0ACD6AI39_AVESA